MANSFRLTSNTLFSRSEEDIQESPLRIVFLSVEGNKTEEQYFSFVEKYRNQLGIKSGVHIHALKRAKHDNLSAPENVLELLEEYLELRNAEYLPEKLRLAIPSEYSYDFIVDYVNGNCNEEDRRTIQFEQLLNSVGIDLEYNFFLKEYTGRDDVFGIVIDRDYKSHSVEQMKDIVQQCNDKGYMCFVTNPLFEFWLLMHLVDIKKTYGNDLSDFLTNDSVSNQHSYTSEKVSEIAGHAKSIREATFVNCYLPNIDYAIQQAKTDFSTNLSELIGKSGDLETKKGVLGSNMPELFDLLRKV